MVGSINRAEGRQAGRSTVPWLVLLVVLALLTIALIVFTGREPDETPKEQGGSPGDAFIPSSPSAPLDPEAFRNEIETLEEQLYSRGPADLASGSQVGYAIRDLAQAVRSRGADAVAADAARDLLAFAAELDHSGGGFSVPNLPATRARWQQLRTRIFGPAAWYADAPSGRPAAGPDPAPTPDPETIDRLLAAAEQLSELLAEGRRQAAAFGEIGVDVAEGTAEAQALYQRWIGWSRQWDMRVGEAAAAIPPRTEAEQAAELRLAHQEMAGAVAELRAVPLAANDTGVPFRSLRERRFTTAAAALSRAHGHLGRLHVDREDPR